MASECLSGPVCVADIDFHTASPGVLGDTVELSMPVVAGGTGHAIMCHWEVFGDRERTLRMSTDPKALPTHVWRAR